MITNSDNNGTILERIGGMPVVEDLLNSLYDELLETDELEPFFRDAPIETIKTHQAVVFRFLLGSEELRPTQKNLINYMLQSHSKLFRNAGLNELHFDLVVKCLLQTFDAFQVNEELVGEIVSMLAPLRVVFEYGAKIAAREKLMSQEQLFSLPQCTAKTLGTDTPVVLPGPIATDLPTWLEPEMRKVTNRTSLRDWTSNLSDRCSGTGDLALADLMMDISIFQLQPYLSTFIQLAFVPDIVDADAVAKMVRIVRYPRGNSKEALPRSLFERMIMVFCKTCDDMNVKKDETKVLAAKLRNYRKSFPKVDPVRINGVTNPPQMLIDSSDELIMKFDKLMDTSESSSDKFKLDTATSVSHSSLEESLTESNLSPRRTGKSVIGPRKWFGGVRKASMNMNPRS